MNIEDVLTLRDESAFRRALHDNLPTWLEASMAGIAEKSRLRLGVYPMGAFARVARASFAGLRPAGASGVATGAWRLPCGLTAAEAWKVFHGLMCSINLKDIAARFTGGFTGGSAVQPSSGWSGPRVVPGSGKFSNGKLRQELNTPGNNIRHRKASIDTRLWGLNAARFAVRLDKAFSKGRLQVQMFITDLIQLRDRLNRSPDLDPQALSKVLEDIAAALESAKVAGRILKEARTSFEDREALAQARKERKAIKEAARADARKARKAMQQELARQKRQERRAARKAARGPRLMTGRVPLFIVRMDNANDNRAADAEVIHLSRKEKREARMIEYSSPVEEVTTGVTDRTGPRNHRRHHTCMKSPRGLPLRRAA